MAYLIDTCVLLRGFLRKSSEHQAIVKAVRHLVNSGEEIVVAVQNIAEFWNASTRPKENNGFGHSIARVEKRVRLIESVATVVSESKASYEEWKRLVSHHAVLGVKVHDARLVSVMVAEQIQNILTLNVADFSRYQGIRAVAPETVIEKANP